MKQDRNEWAKTALFNDYLYSYLLTYKEKQFYNKAESMDNMWLNSCLWSFGMVKEVEESLQNFKSDLL